MTKRIFTLQPEPHPSRIRAAKACMEAPDGYTATIKEPVRSLAENALLHALINEIAQSQTWAGKKRDAETWKRLLVAAWCRTRGEPIELLPALDGVGVDILPARTSKLSKKECADLIEFVHAWHAESAEPMSELYAP